MAINKLLIASLIAISVVSGLIGFHVSRYNAATLIIETKTLEMGVRQVSIVNAKNSSTDKVKFTIGDNTGADCFYAIGLPAMPPSSITIPPLASVGQYQIDRIILENKQVSYSWGSSIGCNKKTKKNGKILHEPCNLDSPLLLAMPDDSLKISAIPEEGFYNSYNFRIATALVCGLGLLLCGIWILSLFPGQKPILEYKEYLSRTAIVLFILVYLYQYSVIWGNAVDVPYWEEWKYYFGPNGLIDGFSLKWLFSVWDYHKIVFTKLIAWLSLNLSSLDFAQQKRINYIIFGFMLLAVYRFKSRVIGKGDFPYFILFMLFMLSPIAYANHAVAQMSQTHFVILFSVVALNYVADSENSIKSAILFCCCILAAMFSYSHGLAFAAVYLVCKSCYVFCCDYTKPDRKRYALLSLCICYLVIGLGYFIWLYVDKQPAPPWSLLSPFDIKFWQCIINLVGLGFGFREESMLTGILCLSITILPVILLVKNKDTRWESRTWQIVTAILGVLAALGAISIGRGSLLGASKSSRYAEFAFMLIPYAAIAWWILLEKTKWRGLFLAAFWFFCLISYKDNWASSIIYRDMKQLDQKTLECIENYSRRGGDGLCPETYQEPIGIYFDRAKKYGVNFTRQF